MIKENEDGILESTPIVSQHSDTMVVKSALPCTSYIMNPHNNLHRVVNKVELMKSLHMSSSSSSSSSTSSSWSALSCNQFMMNPRTWDS